MAVQKLLVLFLAASFAKGIGCISNFEEKHPRNRAGRRDSDQVLGYWNEMPGQAHLLCESSLKRGRVIKTKTEFREKIGFGTGWESANPTGVILFSLLEVNGVQQNIDTNPGTITTVSSYEKYKICGDGEGGSPFQFGDAMAVKNELPGGTIITAYAFKNDDMKQSILNGETLFSIDSSMLGCKLEIVVAIPVPTSGDLSFRVQIQVEKDEGEDEINAGLTKVEDADSISILTDAVTAGDSIGTKKVLMSMAKGLVCQATQSAVSSADISITNGGFPSDNSFTYTANRSAVETCGFVYWDPLMTPLGDYEKYPPLTVGEIVGIVLGCLVVVTASCVLCYRWKKPSTDVAKMAV